MTAQRSNASDSRSDATAQGFAQDIESYRRDVVLLCYRFLGSVSEAEEAAQETALRAWRSRADFRGNASLRTWLHRIAARVCLDVLRSRRRRVLPPAMRSTPADPLRPPEQGATEIAWIEPLPEDIVEVAEHDPAARYDERESVSLAFIAALQVLPPRQRAVLLLRDVLAWSARETAGVLEMSVPAANAALHRARTVLRETHHRTGREAVPIEAPEDPHVRRLLDAYLTAWAADDVDGLVRTLRADVRLAMPPSPSWYLGRDQVADGMRRWIFGRLRPAGGYWTRETRANGQPGVVFGSIGAPERPLGVQILAIGQDGVTDITVFLDEAIASRF